MEIFPPFTKATFEKYEGTPGAIIKHDENSITIRLNNITEYQASQLVLTTCGNAKVHAPDELKLYMRRIANKLLDHLND